MPASTCVAAFRRAALTSIASFFSAWLVWAAAGAASPGALNYEEDIQPIFEARCFKCHGPDQRKANLDLRRRFTLLAGGDSGAAISPGEPGESLIVEMLDSGLMPPKEEDDPLDQTQIDLIKRWIEMGAPTKAAEEEPLDAVETEDTLSEADRAYWAFVPPARPPVPAVAALNRVRTPIDAFLLAKLEEKGLSFSPDASKHVLLRRVYFDLVGLPPTPEQYAAFIADERPDAYERLVDDLLKSPQYGERWGRHWLDVAGYADSDGYLDADRLRPEAWRYRDYVIRALNGDKPYGQFVREQLAGDELSNWREAAEITPETSDQLAATGFLRTAPDPTYPGYAEKLECYKVMADTVQIVSSAFLGITLQCARCHAHKFDPLSQRDYYQLHAVLLPAYDPDRWVVSGDRHIPLATDAERERITKRNDAVTARIQQLNAEIEERTVKFRQPLFDERLAAAEAVDPAARSPEQAALVEKKDPTLIPEAEVVARHPELGPELELLRAAIDAETAISVQVVQLRGLADIDATPSPAAVLRRGDFNTRGQAVEPGVPAVLAPVGYKIEPSATARSTGRRKAFAEWLVSPGQPTTARVHVNRVWGHHFGMGLVETVEDFGRSGKPPTHPALLDWLASEFVDSGWKQKQLHRLIVTSTAYRQSSAHDETKAAIDPENKLLWAWRPQRHEGEVVRDTLLAVAGKLNPEMFGPPVPVTQQEDGTVTTDDDPQGNRRSIYLIVRRSQPLTMLDNFDTPRMEVNCTRRSEAIVATQALVMLNSPFVEGAARSLGERIATQSSERNPRIDFAWRVVFAREPSETERRSIHDFLDGYLQTQLAENAPTATPDQRAIHESAAWQQIALQLLNTNEFLYVE